MNLRKTLATALALVIVAAAAGTLMTNAIANAAQKKAPQAASRQRAKKAATFTPAGQTPDSHLPTFKAAEEPSKATWVTFKNARFGYSVEYPDLFSEMAAPENGDGAWMQTSDESLTLTITGGDNKDHQTGNDMLALRIEGASGLRAGTGDKSWFRIIRENGRGSVFYQYGVVNGKQWASFTFKWPEFRDKEFIPLAKHMEATFTLASAPQGKK